MLIICQFQIRESDFCPLEIDQHAYFSACQSTILCSSYSFPIDREGKVFAVDKHIERIDALWPLPFVVFAAKALMPEFCPGGTFAIIVLPELVFAALFIQDLEAVKGDNGAFPLYARIEI